MSLHVVLCIHIEWVYQRNHEYYYQMRPITTEVWRETDRSKKERTANVKQFRTTETRIGESLIPAILHTERTLNLYF